MNNLVGDVKANPRDFYRYINSQKKDTQGIPPLKRKNGKGVAQSDLEKAEEFNGQFTDVFSKNEHTQVPLLDRSAPFMNDIAVSKDGVIKLLKGLLGPPGFNCWFSSAPVFQWCCSTPQGSPGVGRNTFLSSPHLCFIIVFICDLFVSRDDPLMS